jgi:hypothetical protein
MDRSIKCRGKGERTKIKGTTTWCLKFEANETLTYYVLLFIFAYGRMRSTYDHLNQPWIVDPISKYRFF